MKLAFFKFLSVIAFAAGVTAQSLTINTPINAVVCQPLLLTWTGGTAPYFLSIHSGPDPATSLQDLGEQRGTSLTWIVNIDVGTSIGLTLRDSTGLLAQSAAFTILTGPDRSCVGQPPSGTASGSAPATPGAPAPTPSAPPPATTPAAPTSTRPPGASTSGAASSASRPAASATTTSRSGAPTQAAHLGAAGIVGAAVIALLA